MNTAIKELAELLPDNIGFLLIDYKKRNAYKYLPEELPEKTFLIDIPDQNISEAYKELSTQGNPNDPQVRYRKCLFALGEAAQENKRKKVIELGEELIKICRSSGETSFWASAYLLYAGFMFRFKEEKERITQLLDTGISILLPVYHQKTDCAGVLLQFYMYKGAFFNIIGEKKQAVDFFLKNAALAKELNQPLQAVTGYNYALIIALKKDKNYYVPILSEAFEYGYALTDDDLKTVNLTFIALNYIDKNLPADIKCKEEIERRMLTIYGENWQDSPSKIAKQMQAEYQQHLKT